MGSVLVGYLVYIYRKTNGLTKFAHFNDERLLLLSGEAYKITLFILGIGIISVASFLSGLLGVAYERGELVYNTEQVVQLTFIVTIMGIYIAFKLIYTVVYLILKKKR